MRHQRRRDSDKERRWRRLVKEWQQSGLSIREFCDWQVLSEASFYFWRRELAERDREVSSHGARSVRNGPATATAQFLPVRVVADDSVGGGPNSHIEVLLPSGAQLRVPAGFPRQALAEVIGVLESRPC